jgi:hypothetical protein
MIRHIVLLKFRDDILAAERQAIYDDLRALKGHLDIVAMSFGRNVSPEGLGRGYDDGFTMDFRDAAARDAYLADSAHKAAGARLGAALQDVPERLVVFDLEL